jgi:hypothetical protein
MKLIVMLYVRNQQQNGRHHQLQRLSLLLSAAGTSSRQGKAARGHDA